jgi:hypothetical protein
MIQGDNEADLDGSTIGRLFQRVRAMLWGRRSRPAENLEAMVARSVDEAFASFSREFRG